eukprot:3600668-Amphidinium_carterae.1
MQGNSAFQELQSEFIAARRMEAEVQRLAEQDHADLEGEIRVRDEALSRYQALEQMAEQRMPSSTVQHGMLQAGGCGTSPFGEPTVS